MADLADLTKARSMLILLLATCKESLLALEAAANVLDTDLTSDLAAMITRSERDRCAEREDRSPGSLRRPRVGFGRGNGLSSKRCRTSRICSVGARRLRTASPARVAGGGDRRQSGTVVEALPGKPRPGKISVRTVSFLPLSIGAELDATVQARGPRTRITSRPSLATPSPNADPVRRSYVRGSVSRAIS